MRLSCVPVPRFSSSIFILSTSVALIFIDRPPSTPSYCILQQPPPVQPDRNHAYSASQPNITIRAAEPHPIPSHLPNIKRQRAASPTTTDADTPTPFATIS
jgi:hypothetical protein